MEFITVRELITKLQEWVEEDEKLLDEYVFLSDDCEYSIATSIYHTNDGVYLGSE